MDFYHSSFSSCDSPCPAVVVHEAFASQCTPCCDPGPKPMPDCGDPSASALYHTLFYPGSTSPNSHIFTIEPGQKVYFRGFGLQPSDVVTVEMALGVGSAVIFEPVQIQGDPVTLTAANNVVGFDIPGRYRVVFTGTLGEATVIFS